MTQQKQSNIISQLIHSKNITIFFQPIWDHLHHQVLGYEALARGPSDSPYFYPQTLFAKAQEHDQLYQLEWFCAELAIEQALAQNFTEKIFINLSPSALMRDINISEQKLTCWNNRHPLVVELTEDQPFDLTDQHVQFLTHLRKHNIDVALDDFGSGYSSLKLLLQIEPDYIKLDGFFADTLLSNPNTMTLIEQIITIAEHLNTIIIAEKIESQEQVELLTNLNICYLQGFFIQKPASTLQSLSHMQKMTWPSNDEPYTAASLLHNIPSISPDLSSHQLLYQMRHDKQLGYMAVTDAHKKVLGIVRREELLERHSGPFGHSLNQHTTVADIMDCAPIIVENHLPLSEVGRKLSHANANDLDGAFIITQYGIYQGLGYALELVRRLSNYRLQLARYANPLTMLPGNVPLHRTLQSLIALGKPFEVAYFDLNNFKPFNDCCGYERGDQMIRLVAQLLTNYLRPYARFIGHLGGDDFIVIFTEADVWQSAVRQVQHIFAERSRALYRQEDIVRGGIEGLSRSGQHTFFPLTQLACGITRWHAGLEPSLDKLSEIASYAKKQAKVAPDHYYYDQDTSLLTQ
ncbi:bifunctional diguanylate cyclase/phosphodiesterase [Celerinatantimonas yamalensis]|uniref:Bifunctional diguanylate cyclase/phosphodiesterase n=1 Tax=Celerinatantimonas yamalensis TaxID=559956 RepID=A0ABW9G6K5_9GAMM